jgi:CubicO group peptidase (beta-lactamase class C family)
MRNHNAKIGGGMHTMTRRTAMVGMAAGAWTAAAHAATAGWPAFTSRDASAEGLGKIPSALQAVVDSGEVSGMVTLIWHKGQLLQASALGRADLASGRPMQRDALFRIASMTKPITAVATLMLVEEGKLRLADPIVKWAPEFAGTRVLRQPGAALDDTFLAPRAITIEDLLTHRAGLTYPLPATSPLAKALGEALTPMMIWSPLQPDEWMKRLGALPLVDSPGKGFHYGYSFDVLGFLVARISGMTYRDFLMTRVFGPLGMSDTDFWVPPAKRGRIASAYMRNQSSGTLMPVPLPAFDQPPVFTSGGQGLYSTADDYLTFARMLSNKGRVNGVRLLKEKTVELMTRNRLTAAQRTGTVMGLPTFEASGFGLGVSMVMDAKKNVARRSAGSVGAFTWPGAFGTFWQADPTHDTILILMMQDLVVPSPNGTLQLPASFRAQSILYTLAYQALAG